MPPGEVRKSKISKTSGGYVSITHDNWEPYYTDEYAGEIIPQDLSRAAMIDELDYFNEHAWQVENSGEGEAGAGLHPCALAMGYGNKGDFEEPDVRARLVECEVNKTGENNDAFYASTPPLEAKKMLFSQFASEKNRKGKPLRLSFVDVRKAYLMGSRHGTSSCSFQRNSDWHPNWLAKW